MLVFARSSCMEEFIRGKMSHILCFILVKPLVERRERLRSRVLAHQPLAIMMLLDNEKYILRRWLASDCFDFLQAGCTHGIEAHAVLRFLDVLRELRFEEHKLFL